MQIHNYNWLPHFNGAIVSCGKRAVDGGLSYYSRKYSGSALRF